MEVYPNISKWSSIIFAACHISIIMSVVSGKYRPNNNVERVINYREGGVYKTIGARGGGGK